MSWGMLSLQAHRSLKIGGLLRQDARPNTNASTQRCIALDVQGVLGNSQLPRPAPPDPRGSARSEVADLHGICLEEIEEEIERVERGEAAVTLHKDEAGSAASQRSSGDRFEKHRGVATGA